MTRRTIILSRNGETTVYTGWRATLVSAAAFVIALAVLAVVTFVLLGVAATIGTLLLLLIPAAAIMGLIAWAFGGGSSTRRPDAWR